MLASLALLPRAFGERRANVELTNCKRQFSSHWLTSFAKDERGTGKEFQHAKPSESANET